MNKTIHVLISAADSEQDVHREAELPPGATTSDLLTSLGLPSTYMLSTLNDPLPLAADENLYDRLENHEKIRCTLRGTVGLIWPEVSSCLP